MSYSSTDSIALMYRLIESMALLDYPVVFKGAMVLKSLTNGVRDTERLTKDIDGDWQGSITNATLLDRIQYAVFKMGIPDLYVVRKRDFGEGTSAKFVVYSTKSDKQLLSMDLGVRNNPSSISYLTVNGVQFRGSNPNKIFADKVTAISNHTVYRRVKDIYDLFLLSGIDGFSTQEINKILPTLRNSLGDFDDFKNGVMKEKGLKHAYDMMRSVHNKPDFAYLYSEVYSFCKPFIEGYPAQYDLYWVRNRNTGIGEWKN